MVLIQALRRKLESFANRFRDEATDRLVREIREAFDGPEIPLIPLDLTALEAKPRIVQGASCTGCGHEWWRHEAGDGRCFFVFGDRTQCGCEGDKEAIPES